MFTQWIKFFHSVSVSDWIKWIDFQLPSIRFCFLYLLHLLDPPLVGRHRCPTLRRIPRWRWWRRRSSWTGWRCPPWRWPAVDEVSDCLCWQNCRPVEIFSIGNTFSRVVQILHRSLYIDIHNIWRRHLQRHYYKEQFKLPISEGFVDKHHGEDYHP